MATNLHVQHELTSAREALSQGDCEAVRTAAGRGLLAAVTRRDPHSQAIACLMLAQALTLESQMQWAHRFATKAKVLFSEVEDAAGVSDSLLTLSYVDSSRGRNDQALSAAGDAIAGARGIDRRQAAGWNYYGVASFWTRNYGRARRVLEVSSQFALEETGSVAATFHPLVNACFAEVLRAHDSQRKGELFDGFELERCVAQSWELVGQGMTGNLMKREADPGMFLLEFESCFIASRTGRSDKADRHYLKCLERASTLPRSSWMHALVWWARIELAKATGEARQAAVAANAMVSLTNAGEHVPLQTLAKALRADSIDQALMAS